MAEMTAAEIRAFLLEGTRTAKLATVRSDGRPHVAPVWFLLDGDDVVFNTADASAKGRALRRDGRVALVVDDETPPFAFVLIEGTAAIAEDPIALRTWAEQIAARYMGPERAPAYGARNGVPGELLVRVRPTRMVGQKGVAD